MKKSNSILQAAVVGALLVMMGSANAGTLAAANTVFATENFGATLPAATPITPGALTYSLSTSTTVNAGANIFLVVRLTNGKFTTPTAAATTIKIGGAAVETVVTAGNGVPAAVVTLSTDLTTMQVAITADTVALTLGLGAFTYTPAAGDIDNVNTTLATAGGAVSAAVAVTVVSTAAAALDSTNALPTSVDGVVPTAAIATSAKAITSATSALPLYTGKIDLTATPPASAYTATNVALGSVTFTNVTGTQAQIPAGTTDYTVAKGSANSSPTNAIIEVTPGAGQAFPVGATLSADITSSACGTLIGTPTAAFTAASSLLKTTITVAQASVLTATPIFVCMSAPSATNVAAPITATITGTITEAVGTDANPTVTGTGYALTYNGSQTDARSYIPAAAVGYQSFIRVLNTGSVAAPVSAQFVGVDGTVGTAGVVIGNLAAGGAVTLTAAQIEAVIGAPAGGAEVRPRLRVTAPTNGMEVQSFMSSPVGVFTDMTGAQ